jgi:alginate O-acetyltransferase complex protein AlgI
LKAQRELLIVFFLTGLWHGAAWTFIIWGLYHGAFVSLERIGLRRVLERAPTAVQHVYTILVVMVGWVIFRATSLTQFKGFLLAMGGQQAPLEAHLIPRGVWLTPEVMAAMLLGVLFAVPLFPALLDRLGYARMRAGMHQMQEMRHNTMCVRQLPSVILIPAFILCLALLATSSLNPFLYFRF